MAGFSQFLQPYFTRITARHDGHDLNMLDGCMRNKTKVKAIARMWEKSRAHEARRHVRFGGRGDGGSVVIIIGVCAEV